MPLAIVLTNDWELFGDGSGDYFELQHKPLFELFDVLSANDARITLMAEVFQQWSYTAIAGSHPYAKEIEQGWLEAVSETVRRKSDVQLHLHPQWLNARFDGGRWSLNMENWSLSSLKSDVISKIIADGKRYLEDTLRKIDDGYRCIAFRAGAYCIQPEQPILAALKKNGFIADVSVTKGLAAESYYDFKDANSDLLPWYASEENINKSSGNPSDILELPIHSFERNESQVLKKFFLDYYYKHFLKIPENEVRWQAEKERIKNIRYPVSHRYYKKYQNKGLKFYLSALYSRHLLQLDYDHLTPTEFLRALRNVLKRKEYQQLDEQGVTLPLIASGHFKDMHNIQNLKTIIELIVKEFKGKVAFMTLSEAVNYWKGLTF